MKYIRKTVYSWNDIAEATNVLLDGLWAEHTRGFIGWYRVNKLTATFDHYYENYVVEVEYQTEEESDGK